MASLYNKFRPQSWDAVVGQEGIVETLKNSVIENRIASAYVFNGPRGTGKTTCARIFAKALNCPTPTSPGVPCGVCSDCIDVAQDDSPNFHEIDAACFIGKAKVNLANKTRVSIGEIVNNKLAVEVVSYNFNKKIYEPKKVIGWHKNGYSDRFYDIKLEGGYKCLPGVTLNHKVYDANGNKRPLSDFVVGDKILVKTSTINKIQEGILMGMLLGDAYFTGKDRDTIVEFPYHSALSEYVLYKKSLFRNLYVWGNRHKDKKFSITKNEYFGILRKEWIAGKKLSDAFIKNLDEFSLMFWYMDAGSLIDGVVRFHFNLIDDPNINRIVNHINSKWQLGAKKEYRIVGGQTYGDNVIEIDSDAFFSIVKDYIHPSLYFKVPKKYQGVFKDLYEVCLPIRETVPLAIKKIIKLRKKEDRYDIEVEDNHNYIIGNGIIVSNSNTGVDDMREVKASANRVATGGGWKFYIIDECHMLSKSAWNSVLKLFEEPPQKTVFVLATTELNKVEGTILSRSLRFDFRPIGLDHIISRLKYICEQEKFASDLAALKVIAKSANGGMRDSISILERVAIENGNKITTESVVKSLGITPIEIMIKLSSVITGDLRSGFEIVDGVINNGYDIYQFILGAIDYYRDMLLLKLGVSNSILVDAETMLALQSTGAIVSVNTIREAISVLEDTMNKYRYAENKRILVEIALYKIAGKKDSNVPDSEMLAGMVRSILGSMNIDQGMNTRLIPSTYKIEIPDHLPIVNEQHNQQPILGVVNQKSNLENNIVPEVPVVQEEKKREVVPLMLTDGQWGELLDRVRAKNEDAYSMLKMTRPSVFDRNILPVSFDPDFGGFYDEVFNDDFSRCCSVVLSECMCGEWYVRAVPMAKVNEQHNQQHIIVAPISENTFVQQSNFDQMAAQGQERRENDGNSSIMQEQHRSLEHGAQVAKTQSFMQAPMEATILPDDTPVTEKLLFEKFGGQFTK